MKCAVASCKRRAIAKGYCQSHYHRVRKHGDPLEHLPFRGSGGDPPSCSVEICERGARKKGLCDAHYQRLRKLGELRPEVPLAPRNQPCSIEGCGKDARGRGYCHTHYERWRRTGDASWQPTPKVPQPRMDSQGYVTLRVGGKYELMHRLVWETEHGPLLPGQNIHHKNGDRADNRLENLEIWDTSQPAGQRPQDKVEFAVEMLRRYAPHLLIARWRSRPRPDTP